jgi:hypothetical protein
LIYLNFPQKEGYAMAMSQYLHGGKPLPQAPDADRSLKS